MGWSYEILDSTRPSVFAKKPFDDIGLQEGFNHDLT
jgi:hypothetical protein